MLPAWEMLTLWASKVKWGYSWHALCFYPHGNDHSWSDGVIYYMTLGVMEWSLLKWCSDHSWSDGVIILGVMEWSITLGVMDKVLTKLDFWPLALKMALKVKSDHKFEFFGLCSLCEHGFISPKALYRLLVMFCSAETRWQKPSA